MSQPADAVLALGDVQYENATLAEFMGAYDPSWGRVKAITRPAVGNHEYQTPGASGYFDYFDGVGVQSGPAGDRSQGWYSFELDGWHVVVLNSNCTKVGCTAGSPQETWLRADLAAHPTQCTLAAFHHPRFSSDNRVGSTPAVEPLWNALYDAGAEVVLNGHAHTYERFAPQTPTGAADPQRGIREFIVGTGGYSLHGLATRLPNSEAFSASSLGVMKLSLLQSGYTWEFQPAAGGTFTDSGADVCH
ncbi:MAG: metallophosphoesterase [Solirubrobacteraceae bacterium]